MNTAWRERRLVAGTSGGAELTVYEHDSGVDGPRVLVLGGVHGDEVGGVVAAGRLTLAPLRLRAGILRVVPVTHEAAFAADSRTGPCDGGNLARLFPGNPAGSPTEQLAHLVTERLLRRADVMVDLHTSSPHTDMPLFAGCLDDGSGPATRSVELAVAFGAPVVWTHPSLGAGRSLTVARELGIAALYAESPVGGVLDAAHLDAYERGVRRVLAHLGMLEENEPSAAPQLWLHGAGDVDAFTPTPVGGLFLAEVALLDVVDFEERVGRVLDTRGRTVAELHAPAAGHVVTLRRAAQVGPGTPAVGVAAPRPEVLALPSDALVHSTGRSRP